MHYVDLMLTLYKHTSFGLLLAYNTCIVCLVLRLYGLDDESPHRALFHNLILLPYCDGLTIFEPGHLSLWHGYLTLEGRCLVKLNGFDALQRFVELCDC